MNDIVVCGSGGHAKVVLDVLERQGRYSVQGLLDPFRNPGERAHGYPVIGGYPRIVDLAPGLAGVIVAIGDNFVRARVVDELEALVPDLTFIQAVHPQTSIARGVRLAPGVVVMAGAVVQSDAQIGRHCIINTRASVDHDSVLGDFVSVGPGATLGGGTVIGDHAAIGLGANVIHRIRVGAHAVVGAGATVMGDVPPLVVAFGSPARIVRHRQPGDAYL